MSINNCVFTGRLTRDPELRFTPQGTAVCKFSLAVDWGYGDKKKTSFLNMTAFSKTAEAIANYVNKGAKVTIRSHVQTGSYDAQDGTKRYTTDFIIDEIEFPSKAEAQSTGNNFTPQDEDIFTPVDNPDDIPF